MRRAFQSFRLSFAVLLSLLLVFSPFTSVAAQSDYTGDRGELSNDAPTVSVRVEGLIDTITETVEIQTDTFDLQPYAGGANEIIPNSPRVIHAIIRALEASGIDTFDENSLNLAYGGNYIRGINDLFEFDAGPYSGWMYYVDHEYAPVGVLDFKLVDDQEIVVFYAQNYMENIYSFFEQENYVTKTNETISLALKGSFYDMFTNETEDLRVEDATILVNDQALELDGEVVKTNDQGQVELVFTEAGTYHISATKKNSAGEQIISRPYAKVVVEEEILDEVPPVISVKGLTDGMIVHEEDLSFSLQAIDDVDGEVAAHVSLNGSQVQSEEDGSYKLSLVKGENEIVITAVDSSGNEAVKSFRVFYEEEILSEPVDVKDALDLAGEYILNKGVFSEWEAIGLAQAGKDVPSSYYEIFAQNVEDQITGGLASGRIKITDIERLALAATVIGEDARDVLGHNLIELIYNSPNHASGADTMTFQGNNGPIFALIALDSLDFEVPRDARWTRQALVEELLNNQNDDGSWHLSDLFESPSIDITAMAMIALANYKDQPEVEAALNKTVEYLSSVQTANGGFDGGSFVGGISSEAASQVIIGLTAYGIDPAGPLFTKDQNLIEHLLSFQNDDGGFWHTHGEVDSNAMATEQALQALVAYDNFLENAASLYDFTGRTYVSIKSDEGGEKDEGEAEETDEEADPESEEGGTSELEEEEDMTGEADDEKTESEDADEEGKLLPKTATNIYNFIALGFIMLALSGLILYRMRRIEVS